MNSVLESFLFGNFKFCNYNKFEIEKKIKRYKYTNKEIDNIKAVGCRFSLVLLSINSYICTGVTISENSSAGRARPCQGRGRGFESRFSLNIHFVIYHKISN